MPYEWLFSDLIFTALIGSSLQFDYPFRDSWKKLGHMPQQKALECYIQELSEIDPEWEEKYAVTDDLVCFNFMICINLFTCICLDRKQILHYQYQ